MTSQELIKKIKSENKDVRAEAWQNAAAAGPKALAPLAKLAEGEDTELVRAARRAMWKIVRHVGRPKADDERNAASEQLTKLLDEGTPESVCREVLWMLSEITSENESVERIASLLENATLREDARCALERVPGQASLAALESALPKASKDFKPAIAQSLRARGVEVKGVPCLKDETDAPDEREQAELMNREACSLVHRHPRLAPPNSLTIVLCFLLIVPLGTTANEDDEERVERWVEQLSSEDGKVRKKAIRSLGASGAAQAPRLASVIRTAADDRTRRSAFAALSLNESAYAYNYMFWDELPSADDEDLASTRKAIWDCLIRVGDTFLGVGEYGAASDHYCDMLESAEDSREKALAVLGLGRASRRRAAGEVFSALSAKDPVVRSAANAAVSQLRWGQAAPYLNKELASSETKRIVSLLEALSRRSDAPAAEMVREKLLDENEHIARAARRARSRQLGYLTDWWLPRSKKPNEISVKTLVEATADAPALPKLEGPATHEAAGYEWTAVRGKAEREATGRTIIRLPPGHRIAYSEFTLSAPTKMQLDSEAATGLSLWVDDRPQKLGQLASLDAGLHRVVVELQSPGDGDHREFSLQARDADAKPLVLAPRVYGLPSLELR